MKKSWPLGTRGKIIGVPGKGTHSYKERPNNWQSDRAYDIGCPVGTPVLAVVDGKIGQRFGPLDSKDPRYAGLRCYVEHLSGNEYYYAHLSRFERGIQPESQVTAGTVIGYSGSANGADHLHIGVKSGNPALEILGGVLGLLRHWWARLRGVTSAPHPKLTP